MQRNPRYREGSLLARLPARSLHPHFVHSGSARVSDTLITRRVLAHLSLSFSSRVISYPQRYYGRACNGNRRMIHGDVKRDGSRCRLETQSLPIREQPMPREESGAALLSDKNIKTTIY